MELRPRFLIASVLFLTLFTSLWGKAEERPLPPFKLTPFKHEEGEVYLRKQQIERFNVALAMVKDAYEKFEHQKGSVADFVTAGERLHSAAHDLYETPADRARFAGLHHNVAQIVRSRVQERNQDGKATENDLRQIQYLELTLEVVRVRDGNDGPRSIGPDPRIGQVSAPDLNRADAAQLAKATAKLLDAHCYASSNEMFPDADAKLVVALDKVPPKLRYALWDFEQSKLLRFLSAEVDKGTKPYAGDDAADFGAEVNVRQPLSSAMFTPDKRLIVGLRHKFPENAEWLVWEAETGKLLRTFTTAAVGHNMMPFLDNHRLLVKPIGARQRIPVSIVDIDAGKMETLIQTHNSEVYGAVLHGEELIFTAVDKFSWNLNTKAKVTFNPPPPGTSRIAGSPLWLGPNNHVYFQHGNTIETWDLQTRSFVRDCTVVPPTRSFDILGGAPAANLLARRRIKERRLEFIDLEKSEVVSSIDLPFDRMDICAFSSDSKRLALATSDQPPTILLLNFPDGLPRGIIAIDGLLKQAGRQLVR